MPRFATPEATELLRLFEYITSYPRRRHVKPTCQPAAAGSEGFEAVPGQPVVQLIGEVDHPDFREAIALVRANARAIHSFDSAPELIVMAQSRPRVIRAADVELLRQRAPLAGLVAVLGTWSEGETRTGRPWPGVARCYWYEFPAWFRRQLKLRAAGRCPDWSRGYADFRISEFGWLPAGALGPDAAPATSVRTTNTSRGVIQLSVTHRETADVLTDVLKSAGYATVWHRTGQFFPFVRGALAAIWEGGQLNDGEASELAEVCRRLNRYQTPVIAMLDFPRRDRVDRALECGAATVLAKPWLVEDLLGAIEENRRVDMLPMEHTNNRAA